MGLLGLLKTNITLRVLMLVAAGVLILTNSGLVSAQMTPEQRKTIQSGALYFNVEETISTGNGCAVPGSSGSDSAYASDQVMAFASLPITATWNISDTTAEQWFLKQAGARPTVAKYGLNESNIGDITSTVKSIGVSPVFFYAYTANEGGGAGGFINHYRSDTSGGGVGNASRDAEYLVKQSNIMNSKPSWIDAGNPVDFVPKDVQDRGNAHFQSMPAGTIGRAYIPATAATTWEVYFPDGLKKEFNRVQNYGAPLADTMRRIEAMGGNPLEGGVAINSGSTSSGCPTGTAAVVGEGIQKSINWMTAIAANDGYGYDQPGRTTGWEKWQADPNCTDGCGSFDCSSFIGAALTVAGYFTKNPNFTTSTMAGPLEQAGFTKVASSAASAEGLQPGDILLKPGDHTAMYIGDGKIVHASKNENGGASGGKVGDNNGKEVNVAQFYDGGWTSVYRAPN